MLGLVVLAILAAYLLISGVIVWLAARWAKKRERRGWVWGGVAAFAMYNLVFWDWIPTVVMHKYYCATEAGFWVYKTPEQWVKENPGVKGTLTAFDDGRSLDLGPNRVAYQLNQRIAWVHSVTARFLHVGKFENLIVDESNGEILAREVYFRAGRCSGAPRNLVDFKFWTVQCKCTGEPFSARDGSNFSQFRNAVRGKSDKGEIK